jgi:PAS domain S-box-containing protein
MQDALAAARYVRDMLDRAPEAALIHHRGRVVYANEALAELLRYAGGDALIGKRVLDLVHPDHHDAVTARVDRIYRGGEPAPFLPQRLVGRYGQHVDATVHAQGLDVDGERFSISFVRPARAADDAAHAMIGRLAATIAYELVRPLALAAVHADALAQQLGERDPGVAADAIALRDAAEHGRAIARDLCAIADGDDEGLAPVRVDHAARRALALAAPALHGRAVLSAVIDDAPPVLARATRVVHVIARLLLDAADATDAAAADDRAIGLRVWSAGERVHARVADTAPCATTAALARRLADGGVVRQLIASMNGTIAATSDRNGTAITLSFTTRRA